MKFISWNVNGLRACMKKGFLDFYREQAPDFICLQETKMERGQADVPLGDGILEYWNSAEKKGYSGTAIFTPHQPLAVAYGMDKDVHDHEGRLITLEYDQFYLVCCYTPNSQDGLKRLDYRMEWEDDLREYLMSLDKVKPVIYCGDLKESPAREISELRKKKPVIICGDLNVAATEIDLKNPKANEKNAGYSIQERQKFKELLDAGFTDTFRYLYPDQTGAYTWWSYRFNARKNNAGWRIDYFIISERLKDKIKGAEILTSVEGSDHCPVVLELDI